MSNATLTNTAATATNGSTCPIITDEQRRTIRDQIGVVTALAISGGRVRAIADGIELPVSNGYRVRVRLTPADLYRVERVLVRGGKEFDKGHVDDVDFSQVGEMAYYASCFRNDGGRWTYTGAQS